MKSVIINADDFGINEVVTSEIERNLLAGNVSSTTVMANGSCLGEVKRFAGQHPEFSYGVHLCLSEYGSLTKSEGLKRAGIIDETGQFVHKAIFQLKNLSDSFVQKSVRDELNAQIDVISSLGFPISHADSHHHVHTIYQLKELFADIIQSRGIKKIRLEANFRTLRTRRHLILWMRQLSLNKYYRSRFTTVDAFYSYMEYFQSASREQMAELMCHPGHTGQQFRDEMKMVEEKAIFKNNDIKLITYNDLY